jgi:hypothetical protein
MQRIEVSGILKDYVHNTAHSARTGLIRRVLLCSSEWRMSWLEVIDTLKALL